jgi:hypothetical protein
LCLEAQRAESRIFLEATVLISVCKSGYRFRFAALAGGCLVSTTAWAITIDFNGLPGGEASPFTSYTEAGFTVAPLSRSWLIGQNYGHPPPFIFFKHPAVEGSIATTSANTTFSFSSLDVYSSVTPVPYVFTGLLNGKTVFATSGTVPLPYGKFITVPNPHRADLIDTLQVTLSTSTQNAVGVDNIIVSAATASETASTSLLLTSVLLVGSALAFVALVWRRKILR